MSFILMRGGWRFSRALAGCTAMLAATLAHAQPDPADPLTFKVREFKFSGATAFTKGELVEFSRPYVDRPLGFDDLRALAASLTQHYRAAGYFLAQATVPVQALTGDTAEISVLEGRIGRVEVRLAAGAPIPEERIRGIVSRIHVASPLLQADYERTMLLLSDLPGLKVESGLQEGLETGTTDLVVDVAEAARRWQASAELDNFGTRSSGRDRVSATLRVASPTRHGDNLDAHVVTSTTTQQTFGRLSYEAPIADEGWRLGAGLSRVGYELGGGFGALDATGTADVADAALTYPLLRSRSRNATIRFSLEERALNDRIGAFKLSTKKKLEAEALQLSWESRDDWLGGGYSNADATLRFGDLGLQDAASAEADGSSSGHRTSGRFIRAGMQLSRLQAISARHNAFVSLALQTSNRNLDSSEKLALGGQGAVRAYPGGEVLVDRGWQATAEWRYSASDLAVIALFEDIAAGDVERHRNPLDQSANFRRLRGEGLSLTWNMPYDIVFYGCVAWHGAGKALSDGRDQDPRLLVRLQKTF